MMAELDEIAEMLRRQKEDLLNLREAAVSRRCETAELVGSIEDLRRRAEETQQRFEASVGQSKSKRKK